MKKLIPYAIAAGIAVGTAGCNQKPKDPEAIRQAKKEMEQKEFRWKIRGFFPEVGSDYDSYITDPTINKISDIETCERAKLRDMISGYADWDADMHFLIYKFSNPIGEELKLLSDFENIFVGEDHRLTYLELKEGEQINHEEIGHMFFGVQTTRTDKKISGLDGILVSYERLDKRE